MEYPIGRETEYFVCVALIPDNPAPKIVFRRDRIKIGYLSIKIKTDPSEVLNYVSSVGGGIIYDFYLDSCSQVPDPIKAFMVGELTIIISSKEDD